MTHGHAFVGRQSANACAHVRVERQGRVLALDAIASAPFARLQRRGVQRALSGMAALLFRGGKHALSMRTGPCVFRCERACSTVFHACTRIKTGGGRTLRPCGARPGPLSLLRGRLGGLDTSPSTLLTEAPPEPVLAILLDALDSAPASTVQFSIRFRSDEPVEEGEQEAAALSCCDPCACVPSLESISESSKSCVESAAFGLIFASSAFARSLPAGLPTPSPARPASCKESQPTSANARWTTDGSELPMRSSVAQCKAIASVASCMSEEARHRETQHSCWN